MNQATLVLLEALVKAYGTPSQKLIKNRHVKRRQFAELMYMMKDEIPDIDLPFLNSIPIDIFP